MKPITIIGIGNYLMGDEGVGIHAIEYLRELIEYDTNGFTPSPSPLPRGERARERVTKEYDSTSVNNWSDGVELIDAGTPGMSLLHMIEGRRLTIIIDCADFGGAPGEVRIFDPDDLRRDDNRQDGLHATNLLSSLELAKRTGNYPGRVAIIGIQPKDISMGRELSPEARRALGAIPNEVDRLRRQNNV